MGITTFTKHTKPILTILVLLASILLPSITTQAAPAPSTVPSFATKWGSSGSGNGQFGTPSGVETDRFGNVYVTDSEQNRIQKFNPSGVYLDQWDGSESGNGVFNLPASLTFSPDGNIYVLETYGNRRVMKFDADWNYLIQWGGTGSGNGKFNSPSDIASDSDGNVYVLDTGNRRVQKFDPNGNYITKWGSNGSGNSQFSIPQGIAIDNNNNVYVADTFNNRIQKFDSNGNYITKWGTSGSGNGQFNQPFSLEVGHGGRLYVSDIGNGRIQKFDSSGTYLAQWGSEVSGFAAYYIAADEVGSVYATDANNLCIQKFSYPPETTSLASSPTSPNIQLESTAFTTFSDTTAVSESSLASQDATKAYPLGLVDFSLSVVPGSTNTVSLTFETNLTPSQVSARKYNPNTKLYSDVPNASITDTTLNGNHALKLTYAITDGGPLDDDGLANGTILDPVGLAIATTEATATLADTGEDAQAVIALASALLIASTMILKRYKHNLNQS